MATLGKETGQSMVKYPIEIDQSEWNYIIAQKANIYSQFGEDGILAEVFKRIGVTNKMCVEVGAGNGLFCSNTRRFIEKENWKALLIEKSETEYKRLVANNFYCSDCENIEIARRGEHSLDAIMAKHGFPRDLELLSLDIDGDEYYIWNAMLEYQPKVVVIEYSWDADPHYVPKYDEKESAGYNALIKLASAKGYSTLCVVGHNIIFVFRAYLKKLNQRDRGVTEPEQAENYKQRTLDVDSLPPADALRLNLGSMDQPLEGYRNIDIATGENAYPLPEDIEDGSVDEIRASHILEHFSHRKLREVLEHWYKKLKDGGILKIAVPDFRNISSRYLKGERINTTGFIMGGQTDDNDYHKSLFDEEALRAMMDLIGLRDIKRWESELKDCASYDISLNLMGCKPNGDAGGVIGTTGVKEAGTVETRADMGKTVSAEVDCSKIGAVMSMPRLCFADNMFCAMQAILPMGIKLRRGMGVFWGQVLSRLWQELIDEGMEYILVIDYDTWFTREQFLYMCWMMHEHPDVDALAPLQIKREDELPMLGVVKSEDVPPGVTKTRTSIKQFMHPLTEVVTAHFGLTLIRTSALKKLSKPWIIPVPNKDGEWGENRLDEDIYFWNHFHDEGFKACIANDVGIGHLQLLATFPGKLQDNWKPIHMDFKQLKEEGAPDHCLPGLTVTGQKKGAA